MARALLHRRAGRRRYHHFGEGHYDESEQVIQLLLAEAGDKGYSPELVSVHASGAEAAPSMTETQSPETYIGYSRAENFVSPGGAVKDVSHVYATDAPRLDQWSLGGDWTVGEEKPPSKAAALPIGFARAICTSFSDPQMRENRSGSA